MDGLFLLRFVKFKFKSADPKTAWVGPPQMHADGLETALTPWGDQTIRTILNR